MSSLVMLSGGIDSTYYLAKVLQETDQPVHAHHIHLVNHEGRHEVEAQSCKKIVEFCRTNYRWFDYSESTTIRHAEGLGADIMTVALEAGIVASNMRPFPKWWMVGDCLEDRDNSLYGPTRRGHIEAVMAAACFPNKAPIYKVFQVKPKKELMAYLGPELTALCWGCRTPLDGKPCGECRTCNHLREANR